MTKPETLEEAFLKAKSKFPVIGKKGLNPFYKSPSNPNGSPYMLYDDLLNGVSKPLAENDLYFQHTARVSADGSYYVGSQLIHAPTGTKSEIFEMPVPSDAPQKTGAGITYARRFTLSALLGIASDSDNDANETTSKANPDEVYEATPEQKKIFAELATRLNANQSYTVKVGLKEMSDHMLGVQMSSLEARIKKYIELQQGTK